MPAYRISPFSFTAGASRLPGCYTQGQASVYRPPNAPRVLQRPARPVARLLSPGPFQVRRGVLRLPELFSLLRRRGTGATDGGCLVPLARAQPGCWFVTRTSPGSVLRRHRIDPPLLRATSTQKQRQPPIASPVRPKPRNHRRLGPCH